VTLDDVLRTWIEERLDGGDTISGLAEDMGIQHPHVSKYRRDKSYMRWEYLSALAEKRGIAPSEFLSELVGLAHRLESGKTDVVRVIDDEPTRVPIRDLDAPRSAPSPSKPPTPPRARGRGRSATKDE
jgi:transcriptional regulator with XRE-family HTH domain